MAIDGHPWATVELDEMRARQRRWLRTQPAWRCKDSLYLIDVPANAAQLEVLFRVEADRKIEAIEDDLSEPEATDGELMLAWCKTVPSVTSEADVIDFVVDGLRTSANEAAKHARKDISAPSWFPTQQAITLLLWADDLAGDYSDDRFKRHA